MAIGNQPFTANPFDTGVNSFLRREQPGLLRQGAAPPGPNLGSQFLQSDEFSGLLSDARIDDPQSVEARKFRQAAFSKFRGFFPERNQPGLGAGAAQAQPEPLGFQDSFRAFINQNNPNILKPGVGTAGGQGSLLPGHLFSNFLLSDQFDSFLGGALGGKNKGAGIGSLLSEIFSLSGNFGA